MNELDGEGGESPHRRRSIVRAVPAVRCLWSLRWVRPMRRLVVPSALLLLLLLMRGRVRRLGRPLLSLPRSLLPARWLLSSLLLTVWVLSLSHRVFFGMGSAS